MSDFSSPPNGPGRPKDLAKRQAILEAAQVLFLRHGYEGSSMDAIAAEAGVSKLTVYNHFTDKETLYAAAIKAKCEEQLPQLIFDQSDEAPIETVLNRIGMAFDSLINSPESIALHRLLISTVGQEAKLAKLFYDAGPLRLVNEMDQLLRRADQKGQLRVDKPQEAAEHFFCLIKGGANFRLLIGYGARPAAAKARQHVAEVVELFMRAYRR